MTSTKLIAVMLMLVPGVASAADPEPAPELTPEEQKAIEDALGAPTPDPAPAAPTFIQSMNPDISIIFDGTLSWFSDEDPEQLGDHDPSGSGFKLQQVELHASANVDPFFRLDTNLVFGEDGVEVEEAYATTLAFPGGLQMRAGQFLTRFGRRNPTHPHQWAFLDQPLALGKFFGSEGNSGLGLEVSWLTPLPWYVELVVSAQNVGENRSYAGEDETIRGLDDFMYLVALKQFFDLSDDWALQWGLSAEVGPNASGSGQATIILGTDLFLRWKPTVSAGRTSFDILIEGLMRSRDVAGDTLTDWGGFAELRWQIDAEWAIAGRHEIVSGLDGDPLDPEWTGTRQRSALALDFMPSHFSRLRLQGGVDQQDWKGSDALGGFVMLGLEVGIGAHGSHSY